MDRGKLPSAGGRGTKSKAPQHPQDIFALGSKSTVVVSSSEKRNIHKPSSSGVERKREPSTFGAQPPSKRSRTGSPAESVGGTSLEVDPVDLVPNVLQALDTHNSDKLLGLLTGSIRLLKAQRSKPDPVLCASMLYLTKIRPNMFAHEVVTQSLCTVLKREQGAAFKSKGNPLVFVLACNMLYAGHKDSTNWPDIFIKVYIEDALNERWWVECSWCKCLVENIVTAFSTKAPPPHLIPTDSALGTMSPSGAGSPLTGGGDEEVDITDLEYSVFPRYSSSYEAVEGLVLEAIKEQLQRRAAPDAIGKGFLKLLAATCGFPEIRMIAASRLEAWLHSGKLWRCAQELLAYVCCNADACGPTAARDHEVLAQLARMRLKTKPLQQAYQACLKEMVADSPPLLRSVVTHTIYNELSSVRAPNNMAVLTALVQAQPQLVPAATAATYQELLLRPEDYLRPLRALTRELVRTARADVQALLPLARGLATPPATEPPTEVRERAFSSLADLFCCCLLVTASHSKHTPEYRQQLGLIQASAVGWLLETAVPLYRPPRHLFQQALNKIMFVESAEAYSKVDNWPPESERALLHRLCAETPLPQNTLLRVIFIGLSKDIPVSPAEVFELVEQLVRRACALPPEDNPLTVDKLEIADYIFQLCTFTPPDNITLPPGYSPPPLAITSLYWRGWMLLVMLAAHNPHGFAEQAAAQYPTLRALIETCITGKPSIEWNGSSSTEAERAEAEKAAILQLETHLATASNAKLPITEHSSRLLSQLCALEPLGPARKPPQTIVDTLQQLSGQLRLGRLLCRQPALLLELVERHGTRRAMPWLQLLMSQDQLTLSVLPVQCLCEFLSAGGGGEGKTGELAAHLRTVCVGSAAGARAVLQHYLQRLRHPHPPTRLAARRGLKLVLSEETVEVDYNADVSPDQFLPSLPMLPHWATVRSEALSQLRGAVLAECAPRHVAAYIRFLAQQVEHAPAAIVTDMSSLLMERLTMLAMLLPGSGAAPERQHRTLADLTHIFYTHLQQLCSEDSTPEPVTGASITLQWSSGRCVSVCAATAHASLKLLCYGPSRFDSGQRMFSWLQSLWLGPEQPQPLELADLLPDWLRLHLVRSARPQLLEAGLRGLPAHKLALFIQTFGMPVVSMNALLAALDSCPVGVLQRLGVERGYMGALLGVQRRRGATAGQAFASAVGLPQPPPATTDENLFSEPPLPSETCSPWLTPVDPADPVSAPLAPVAPVPAALAPAAVPTLLAATFGLQRWPGDIDTSFTQLLAMLTEELKHPSGPRPCFDAARSFLESVREGGSEPVLALLRRPGHGAALLRTLLPAASALREIASSLLSQCKCQSGPVVAALRAYGKHKTQDVYIPLAATAEQLVAALESASPSSLEALGGRIIASQDSQRIVDALTALLENHQRGKYDTKIKTEAGSESEVYSGAHTLSRRGLGCGLLLDWLAELQRDTLHHRQMRLMFEPGGAAWRPLLVTLLAHRASWTTLHTCLSTLLQPNGSWAPSAVLEFAETLGESGRVGGGRERGRGPREDTLRLQPQQLETLIRYIVLEAEEAHSRGGVEAMRQSMERRLGLLELCTGRPQQLLAAAVAASSCPALLLLLYIRMPRILTLLRQSSPRPPIAPLLPRSPSLLSSAALSPAASDPVSHTLLTAIAAARDHAAKGIAKDKIWRMEALLSGVWSRVEMAAQRALPLATALLRGAVCGKGGGGRHSQLLLLLELLDDGTLAAPHTCEEVHAILDCFLLYARQTGGRREEGPLLHRLAAVLRRYLAARAQRAHQLLHLHRDTIASTPALSSLQSGEAGSPASASPPPAALLAVQRRDLPLHTVLQELESWGSRRGGAWGGPPHALALLRAAAPLAAEPHAATRQAALDLLAKLLPAAPDTTPGLQAVLQCLASPQPEVAAACLDKLPDLIAGMQEHAGVVLDRVFELGLQSQQPVEQCLARCVGTINLQRGC